MSYKVVAGLIKSTPRRSPVLPVGYGINVNIPPLFPENYTSIPVIQTRMTGHAETDEAVANPNKPGTFTWGNYRPLAAGVNRCLNGDCRLPGETYVVNGLGVVSLSLYTVDYSAPEGRDTKAVERMLRKGGVVSKFREKGGTGRERRFVG